MSGSSDSTRLAALDVVRGLAVLGMIWVHLIATEGGADAYERVVAEFGSWFYDLPAALFCFLVGVSWSLQAERAGDRPGGTRRLLWRALVLAIAGIVFGRTVWPTEILSPMALMMVCLVFAWRLGLAGILLSLLIVLVAMPLAYEWVGDMAWTDWNDDGTAHRAEHELGWITLRYYLYSGNYPLVGWLAFPLIGGLAVRLGVLRRALALWHLALFLPLAATVSMANAWCVRHADELGGFAHHLGPVWVPTTIPYVLAGALASWALVAMAVAIDVRANVLAVLGRASLTHYVLHVVVVFVPLRMVWPDEDWSITVGTLAFAGYLVVALPVTWWWFRRRRRGPLEGAWAFVCVGSR